MYQGGMAVGGIFTSDVNKDWTLQGQRQGQEPSLQGPGQGQGLDLQGQEQGFDSQGPGQGQGLHLQLLTASCS